MDLNLLLKDYGRSFEEEIEKEKLHVLDINERQKKAIKYVKENLSITRRKYMKMNNVSHTTAQKELKDLVMKKVFRIRGAGKYIHYELTQG